MVRLIQVNLREMAVLGGTLHLDLVLQPPQPRDMRTRLTITVRKSVELTPVEIRVVRATI